MFCVVCSMVPGGFLCGSHWIILWLVWFTPWFSQRLISNEEQSVHVHSGSWGPCRPERMFSRDFLCCPRSERSVNLRERKQQRWEGGQGPWIQSLLRGSPGGGVGRQMPPGPGLRMGGEQGPTRPHRRPEAACTHLVPSLKGLLALLTSSWF